MRGQVALGAWLGLWAAACSTRAQAPTPDGGAPDGGDALVIVQVDGSPIPVAFAYGTPVAVRAAHDGAVDAAFAEATWTASGSCAIDGPRAIVQGLNNLGLGPCTLTATADGLTATVTFSFIVTNGIAVTGDTTSPFVLGETRTLTAKVDSPAPEATEVAVTWTPQKDGPFEVEVTGATVKVTAVAVGRGAFGLGAGGLRSGVELVCVPSAIKISASSTHVRSGADVIIKTQVFGPDGAMGRVTESGLLALVGGQGFHEQSLAVGRDGSMLFLLSSARVDCPAIQVVARDVVSNTLSVTVEPIASVVIQGPADPVVVGSTVVLRAVPMDAAGQPFSGHLSVQWTAISGIYGFNKMPQGILEQSFVILRAGTESVYATVNDVVSAPFMSSAVAAP